MNWNEIQQNDGTLNYMTCGNALPCETERLESAIGHRRILAKVAEVADIVETHFLSEVRNR